MNTRLKRLIGSLGLMVIAAPMLVMILISPQSAASGFLQATPDIFGTESPDVSPPAHVPSGYDCVMQPVGILDLLVTLNRVEDARYDGRLGSVPINVLTRGDTLSEEDASGIEWTVYQLIACANGLDPLRVLPLLSSNMQASLVSNAVTSDDWGNIVGTLPLLTTDVTERSGLPALNIITAWYPSGTTKSIDSIIEVPIAEDGSTPPQFLVTFIYAERMWVIDRVWLIET